MELVTVSGVLAGTEARPYKFEDKQQPGRWVEGITRKVWVSSGGEPTEVHVKDLAVFDTLCSAPFLSTVELKAELSAQDRNKLRRTLTELVKIGKA